MTKKTLPVSFRVTEETLSDILTSAVEAGVYGSQWLRDFDATADYGKAPLGVIRVTLRDALPGSECETDGSAAKVKCKRVDLARVAWALGEMLSDSDDGTRWNAGEAIGENLDGPRADCVLQFAVFGAVIFG